MEITRENLLTLIKSGIDRDAMSVSGLERQAHVPKDTVRDFLRGKTQILRADKLQKILRILEPQDTVRLAGSVGESGLITFGGMAESRAVDCPPGCDPCDVVAVQVAGGGCLPLFHDGWIIYFSRRQDVNIPVISGGWQVPYEKPVKKIGRAKGDRFADFLGKPSMIGLTDDRVFIGTLKQAGAPGHYAIVNYSGADILDIQPQWAAKIIFIKTD